MARRKRTIVDGQIIEEEAPSIQSVLDAAGIQHASHVLSGGEVISSSDFNRPAPSRRIITNQTNIIKGAALRDRLLDQEFELISTQFLGHFDGIPRSLELDDDSMVIRSFPLPDDYSPDHIDLLFVITRYYEVPPAGVHIPSDCSQINQISKHLGGHVHASIPSSDVSVVNKYSNYGRHYICFQYKDLSWQLNPHRLLAGDCLYKFIENLFVALSGGFK